MLWLSLILLNNSSAVLPLNCRSSSLLLLLLFALAYRTAGPVLQDEALEGDAALRSQLLLRRLLLLLRHHHGRRQVLLLVDSARALEHDGRRTVTAVQTVGRSAVE